MPGALGLAPAAKVTPDDGERQMEEEDERAEPQPPVEGAEARGFRGGKSVVMFDAEENEWGRSRKRIQ